MKKLLSIILGAAIIAAAISSCSNKKDDPTPSSSNNTNTNTNSTYYFKGKFDNATYNQATSSNANAFNNGIGSSSVGNYVDYGNSDAYVYEFWEGSYWSKITYQGGFNEVDALVMRVHKSFNYIGYDYPSTQDIKNIYAPGNYTNFSTLSTTNSNYPTTQGWDIELTDSNGKEWASYKGTASQTGSYIEIDSQKDVYIGGTKFLTVKGSISCKLYDDNGNVKVLEGSFNQLFSDYSVN